MHELVLKDSIAVAIFYASIKTWSDIEVENAGSIIIQLLERSMLTLT